MNNPTPPGDETPPGNVPPGETPKPGSGETPPTTPTIDDALKQIESLQAALKKANAESAGHRHKAKELDDLKAKLEADKLSETEKLQKQLADATKARDEALQAAQERTVNYEVRLQAAQLGIADPGDAVKLLDWSEIEYAEDSSPKNVKSLLEKLLKNKPYLAGKALPPTSGGATNPPRSQTNRQELSWAIISKMTAQEYESRRAEIQQFMQDHPAQFGQRLR